MGAFFKIGGYIVVLSAASSEYSPFGVIIAVIMHGLSAFFEGEGEFRRTFEFVGYGFFPSLVGSLITVPMFLHYITNARILEISLVQLQQNSDIVGAVILTTCWNPFQQTEPKACS